MTDAERVHELQAEITEILNRAYKYDDKPHQLYSGIAALAKSHPDDLTPEIVRLMNGAYEGKNQRAEAAQPGEQSPADATCACTPEQMKEVKWGAAVGAALEFGDCPRCFKPQTSAAPQPTEQDQERAREIRSFLFTRVGNPSLEEIEQAIAAALARERRETAQKFRPYLKHAEYCAAEDGEGHGCACGLTKAIIAVETGKAEGV